MASLPGLLNVSVLSILGILLTACLQAGPDHRPMVTDATPVYSAGVSPNGRTAPPVVPAANGAVPYDARLTMREAVRRAIRYSPVLRAAILEIDAKHAEAFQAGRLPNPEFNGEIENFGGTGEFQGFKSAETTLGLTQVIELGGKRIKRMELAEWGTALSAWDFEALRLNVATEAALFFIDVLATQRGVAVVGEFFDLTTDFRKSVAERVEAGKASAVELLRADVELANAKIQLAEVRAGLDVARRQLALTWSSQTVDFGRAEGTLAPTNHLPSADRMRGFLYSHPEIARWAEEMAQREAIHRLALAQVVPDLNVGAGVRQLDETQDTAAVARAGINLPIFNRNRGNIEAAEWRIARGEQQKLAARNELTSRFVAAYGLLKASEAKLRSLRGEVIPAAEATYEATEQGYREGKFDLLRLLDARRSLIQSRIDLLNTQADFHKSKTRIEALIGRDLYGFDKELKK